MAKRTYQHLNNLAYCHSHLAHLRNKQWKFYYFAGSQRIAMRYKDLAQGNTLVFLLSDHLGGTNVVVSSSGEEEYRLLYRAFGEQRNTINGEVEEETLTDYRYTGQLEQADVGLYYYGARWYDPALGRFTQPDTLIPQPGNPLDWDRYAYVRNSPVNYTDPTGHMLSDGCSYEGCTVENSAQSFMVRLKTLVENPRSWNELPQEYKTVLSRWGVSEKTYGHSEMAGNLTYKARRGDLGAAIQLIIPSHIGFRLQVEGSIDVGVGVSGTIGVNGIYNRNSGGLAGNVDWSVELGGGIGAGLSGTGGLLVGWASSNVDDVIQGYSGIISGTAAAEGALSVALTAPLDPETGFHVDRYSGQVPATLYIGGGAGGAYAGVGAGVNGPMGVVVDFTQLFPRMFNH